CHTSASLLAFDRQYFKEHGNVLLTCPHLKVWIVDACELLRQDLLFLCCHRIASYDALIMMRYTPPMLVQVSPSMMGSASDGCARKLARMVPPVIAVCCGTVSRVSILDAAFAMA